MTDCARLAKCPFFNDRMAGMPAMAEMYKRQYCRGVFGDCARFIVADAWGPEKVPSDLFPNQADRARSLLAQGN
jgi:methyl-accepting chemotaxis protein